jgi:tetratricopeptide (TPR) repeat protein
MPENAGQAAYVMKSDPLQNERLRQATKLIRSGKAGDAIALLDLVLESDDCNLWALEERGRAKQCTHNLEGALADFSRMVERWPEDTRGYTSRADTRWLLGDMQGAIDDYSSAIRINPEHDFAYLQRGRIKAQLGDLSGAIADFSADMTHSTEGHLSGLLNRGEAKHRMKDFGGAIQDLTAAMEIEMPPPVHSPLLRARVKSSLGDLAGAIADYSVALTSFPGLTNALRERAAARLAIGDDQGAAADRAEYQRLGGQDLPAYT